MVQKKKLDENATMLYRMGFRDSDLKLKSHDDIVLWLYNNDKIILDLFKKYFSDYISNIKNYSINNLINNYNKMIEENNIIIEKIKSKIKKFDKMISKIKETEGNKDKLLTILKDYYYERTEDNEREIDDFVYEDKNKELYDKCNKITNDYKNILNKEIEKGEHSNEEMNQFIKRNEDSIFKYCIEHNENDFEYIIENSKKYDIGFIDLRRIVLIDYIAEKSYSGSVNFNKLTLSNIVNNKISYYIKFFYLTPTNLDTNQIFVNLYFEAKTEYFTLGELIRQLQLYRKYTLSNIENKDWYFLVGPKHPTMNDFPEFLKQQGWIFVEIPFEIKKEDNNNNNIKKKSVLDYGKK